MATSPAPRRPRRRVAVAVVAAALAATALAGCEPPTLAARTVVSGRADVWEIAFTPAGTMLWTERGGRIMKRTTAGAVSPVSADLSGLRVAGETGLMGLAVDPSFRTNKRIYTCMGYASGGTTDVRVVPWVFNEAGTALTRRAPIVTGLPATSGRHGGCRLLFDASRRLYVGTGDAAIGTTPQDLTSLGGKILRVDPDTGAGTAGNPFADSSNANTRRIWSYGHRNVQGLAIRPANGTLWSAEHGPDRDDEVNRAVAGNFGWNPVPGYDEGVPMTDTAEFPDAKRARWSSGSPTVATAGITWLDGERWGTWDDHLVVATLKGQRLLLFRPESDGRITLVSTLYQGTYGRIRAVRQGPDGNLYIGTSNGSQDRIIRITPS
ncbi:MAG TPA: PQQ-dependent sugar dehydrogenase [Iamia sp.]|nr:PQQ-dependent sugar dehydrogenase [Iamia sp.]